MIVAILIFTAITITDHEMILNGSLRERHCGIDSPEMNEGDGRFADQRYVLGERQRCADSDLCKVQVRVRDRSGPYRPFARFGYVAVQLTNPLH